MKPELMSPFFVKKTCFFFHQKHVFLTKNGLINWGFMSIKQLNKERQPLVVVTIIFDFRFRTVRFASFTNSLTTTTAEFAATSTEFHPISTT